jgi:hypothetical protein
MILQKETKQPSGEFSKPWKKRTVFFQALENLVRKAGSFVGNGTTPAGLSGR